MWFVVGAFEVLTALSLISEVIVICSFKHRAISPVANDLTSHQQLFFQAIIDSIECAEQHHNSPQDKMRLSRSDNGNEGDMGLR